MISVVIPYYNEGACAKELLPRTEAALAPLGEDFEVVVVDNGSSEAEALVLERLAAMGKGIRIVRLSRNFGYQGALWAGLDAARGDAVVFMDGDGEDPPEVIPEFVAKWREGFAVVYGVRLSRRSSRFGKFCYWAFYRVLARSSPFFIPLDAGEFSLISGRALGAIRNFSDRTRMLRILRAWVGFKQAEVPYHRRERIAGTSKFGFFRAVTFAWDGFVASTDLPVRLSIYASVCCFFLGAIGSIYYLCWYFFGNVKIPGFASLNITLLVLFAILFACFSIMARYIITLLDETRKRPPYLVEREINPGEGQDR